MFETFPFDTLALVFRVVLLVLAVVAVVRAATGAGRLDPRVIAWRLWAQAHGFEVKEDPRGGGERLHGTLEGCPAVFAWISSANAAGGETQLLVKTSPLLSARLYVGRESAATKTLSLLGGSDVQLGHPGLDAKLRITLASEEDLEVLASAVVHEPLDALFSAFPDCELSDGRLKLRSSKGGEAGTLLSELSQAASAFASALRLARPDGEAQGPEVPSDEDVRGGRGALPG